MIPYFDSHVHSSYSPDSETLLTDIFEHCKNKTMIGVSVTDHLDVGYPNFYEQLENVEASVKQTKSLKEKYEGKLILSSGVELGQPLNNKEQKELAISKLNPDYLLLSIHDAGIMGDVYFINYKEADINKLMNFYFDDMLNCVLQEDFDSLAHITYPLRYILPIRPVNIWDFKDIIDEIFLNLIKRDRALEVNARSFDQDLSMPDIELFRRYKQLGGEKLTIGSDGHTLGAIGKNFGKISEILKDIGFNSYCYFLNRTAYPIKL